MICTSDDEFVREKPRWVVVLDDGTTVYQDDDRPGVHPPSAWVRLKAHCGAHGRHIRELWLQFRSHRVLIEPVDASGYFFVKLVYAVWGSPETHHGFIVGVLDGDIVHTTTWSLPELLPIDRGQRPLDPQSDSIILGPRLTGKNPGL